MKYDAVIVGSGPAGSVTARFAAKSGAKVLMIERRQEVGVPVLCGEGISKNVDEFKVLEGRRWIANNMDGARIFSPDGTMVTLAAEMAGNETGYVLYRDIFDQELASGAIRAGAKLMLDTCAVDLIKKDGKIIKNPLRPLVNMDRVPIQDWELFDKRHLYRAFKGDIYKNGTFEFSRGCQKVCSFCVAPRLRKLQEGLGFSFLQFVRRHEIFAD